jgi:hypothetical protein
MRQRAMRFEEAEAARRPGTPKGSVFTFITIERPSTISQPPIDRSRLFLIRDVARRSGGFFILERHFRCAC